MFGFGNKKRAKGELPAPDSGCFVSDHISRYGKKVGYMYREEPDADSELPDSGWHFFSGEETDEYVNEAEHIQILALCTVCSYDSDIMAYLDAPYGSSFYREGNKFIPDC